MQPCILEHIIFYDQRLRPGLKEYITVYWYLLSTEASAVPAADCTTALGSSKYSYQALNNGQDDQEAMHGLF